MEKLMVLAIGALLCSTPRLSAAMLTEDFETAYSPGATVTATWGTQDSYVNPNVWTATGGNNWSRQTLNGDGVNDVLNIVNCNQSYSKAGFSTISNAYGFNSAAPTTYDVDLLSYSVAGSQGYLLFGVIDGGDNWDTSTDGFILGFADYNFLVQQKVNGTVTTLCSGNHNGDPITHFNLTLSSTSYAVDFTGMGYYNVSGAFSGTLTNAMDTGKVTIEMFNDLWAGPGNASVDNIVVVPEPATLALLTFGSLMLRRKK